jgi:NADH:ubiquinone oxidoreductase subunit 3 (subunit A)
MKHIIIALITAAFLLSPSTALKKITISEKSSGKNPVTVLQIEKHSKDRTIRYDDDNLFNYEIDNLEHTIIISVIIIALVFCLPVFIIFIIYNYRYKDRKAKYKLAEQALAAGQPIPDGLFKDDNKKKDLRVIGIKNIFTGIGLFIYLWAVTNRLEIGCVGLLIMFAGFGKLLIHYTQSPNKKGKNPEE